jgi:hypothetical protein
MQILSPFGPQIAKIQIPLVMVEKLNNYTNEIIEDDKKRKKLEFGNKLVGNVSQEFQIEGDFGFKSGWFEFLAQNVREFIFQVYKKNMKKCTILNSWIVRQFSNEYNPLHTHSGHLSGAGWLKIPSDWGEFYNEIKKGSENPNGCLDLVYGTPMFLNHAIFRTKPKVGDFFIFPHYLMHCVWPFKSNISDDPKINYERRSISFNANVDDQIFNIYG